MAAFNPPPSVGASQTGLTVGSFLGPSFNYSTPGQVGNISADGSVIVDTEDMTFAFVPSFTGGSVVNASNGAAAAVSSQLGQGNISPFAPYAVWAGPPQNYAAATSIVGYGGVPALNALLVELRVFVALLAWQQGDQGPDTEQMRAEELFDSSLVSGVA